MPDDDLTQTAEPQEPAEPTEPQELVEPSEPAEPQEPAPKKKKQTAQERIDELTFKYREMERVNAEKEEQTRLLLDQNKQLLERFDAFEGRFEDDREPDRFEEPQKHDEWLMKKFKREILKDVQPQTPQEPAQPIATNQKITPEQLASQEASMRILYDDYDDVIEEAKKDMTNDPMLRSEVWQSNSPPKKAYEYIIKKRERAKQQRDTGLDQQFVEGGGAPTGAQPKQLTKEQKDVADKMGISHEDYKKQLDIIEGRASE